MASVKRRRPYLCIMWLFVHAPKSSSDNDTPAVVRTDTEIMTKVKFIFVRRPAGVKGKEWADFLVGTSKKADDISMDRARPEGVNMCKTVVNGKYKSSLCTPQSKQQHVYDD